MSDSNNSHTPIIVGLILAMVFLIAAPVTFFLVKKSHESQPVLAAPAQPAAPATPQPIIVTPPAQPVVPPVIVAPVVPPTCPPHHHAHKSMYERGWADARAGLRPDPRFCNNPAYQAGYRDFCNRYRPGFRFDFRINVR